MLPSTEKKISPQTRQSSVLLAVCVAIIIQAKETLLNSMTQPDSQVPIQLNGNHVTQYLPNMQQRDDTIMQHFKACRETIMDAAQLYVEEKDDAQLGKLREQLVSLIQTEQQITHHKAALGSLYLNYQPSLDTTDFKSTLQQHMQLAEANSRFDPEADEDVKEFDAATGVEAPQKQDLDEDEDLMMVGDVVKNDKCPYTKKDLVDLDEPMEDHLGFVYEKKAVMEAFQHALRTEYSQFIECPVPGVNHTIFMNQLKPVNKRRLQRLARVRQQQAGTQAPRGVVLDA